MSMILVTPLSAMPDSLRAYHPSHLVSMLSPEYMIETPEGFPAPRHLRLSINDVADPAAATAPPALVHVSQLIAFGRGWNGSAPMLVHCWAGVSRSMAGAFMILCDRAKAGAEHDIAQAIRARAPHASPNRLLVRLADHALNRGGRMVRAVEAMGPGILVEEGFPVELPLTLGAL